MKVLPAVLVAVLLLLVPNQLFAKAKTSKIVIEGADLKNAIEITHPNVLKHFFVWTGPGTSVTGPPSKVNNSFIVNWTRPLANRPEGLQRYQVSFFANLRSERLIHVVFYEYDPASGRGYVYLPGKGEKWYPLNVTTILRRVEGQWFHASKAWDKVAGPLVASAKEAVSR